MSFHPQGISVEVVEDSPLIDAVRRAGLPLAAACDGDVLCARCGVSIVHGLPPSETAAERRVKARNRIDPGLRLACAVRVRGDLSIRAAYWGDSAE